jgi:uncharacterized protein YukJ
MAEGKLHYGVLRGKVDRHQREDDLDTPHLQIRVLDGAGEAWRVPVNVLSGDGSHLIFHRVDPLLSVPILDRLPQYSSGFTPLPALTRTAADALDFLRAPLFAWETGVEVVSTAPGDDNDLQDFLITYLDALKAQGGDIYAFGAKFPKPSQAFAPKPIDQALGTNQGVHDIHMNQGNPEGPYKKDNGTFQDGSLLLAFPNRVVGLFLRFKTQWLPTDDFGHRLPNAQPIPPGGTIGGGGPGGGGTTSPMSHPEVYIERALVNPRGSDVGLEVVVLGNTTTSPIDLGGWSLEDKNRKRHILTGRSMAPGASLAVELAGADVQLSNQGGTIVLKNADGNVVHSVSYARADAQQEGRYLRFNT